MIRMVNCCIHCWLDSVLPVNLRCICSYQKPKRHGTLFTGRTLLCRRDTIKLLARQIESELVHALSHRRANSWHCPWCASQWHAGSMFTFPNQMDHARLIWFVKANMDPTWSIWFRKVNMLPLRASQLNRLREWHALDIFFFHPEHLAGLYCHKGFKQKWS